MKHLERMIQEAANGVEDTIDSHAYDRHVLVQSNQVRSEADAILHQNLEYAIEEIGLIQKEVMKKKKVNKFNSKISHSRDTSSQIPLDQKDVIIGLDEDLLKIKDRLIVQSSRLEVVPIIWMGGIGKTTLARRVYDDSLIACHFYVRAWTNVSQEFDTREIFLGILHSIGVVNDEVERNSTNEQLVDRSLVLMGKHTSLGKIKTCKMHDLVRDMCLREAHYENFIHFKTRYDHDDLLENINCLRRVADFHKYTHSELSKFTPLTRSVFFKYPYIICSVSPSSFRLLRILDVCFKHSLAWSPSLTKLVHLRYLACPSFDGLVQSICKLRNLQNLVIHDSCPFGLTMRSTHSLPWEVVNMPQLRHIHTKKFSLFIPPPTSLIAERENHLQTITGLMPSSCNDEVFLRIPNLKKLGILIVVDSDTIGKCYCLDNLVHLTQLEKLKVEVGESYMLIFRRISEGLVDIPHCDNFPPNLKKLTLCRTHLQWEDMNILRKLPNLEVLKLKHHAFDRLIWKLSDEEEDGFLKLKFLLLETMSLKQWEATSYHFPSLEHLVLTECWNLEQIPFDFAEIQTLQLIELHECMRSVLVSAEQIQEEQQSFGNDDLIIRVNSILEKTLIKKT